MFAGQPFARRCAAMQRAPHGFVARACRSGAVSADEHEKIRSAARFGRDSTVLEEGRLQIAGA